ncbi:MAG: PilZ domain-containing protein [Halobacteriota archaeon]
MNRPERRKEQRLALSRRAQLISDAGIRQCLLQDISSGGFLILTNERYASGEVLELACELYPQQVISCKIQVRHVDDTCIGTLIVDISPQAASLLGRFLEEHNSQKLKDRPQSAGDDLDFTKDS